MGKKFQLTVVDKHLKEGRLEITDWAEDEISMIAKYKRYFPEVISIEEVPAFSVWAWLKSLVLPK